LRLLFGIGELRMAMQMPPDLDHPPQYVGLHLMGFRI
jgi:hypothetical protein